MNEPLVPHGEQPAAHSLTQLSDELLEQARAHSSQRAAATLAGGPMMRATLIAMTAGAQLAEHDAPPAATLQTVTGHVVLQAGPRQWRVGAGDLVTVPQARHRVIAESDSVILLTVALHGPAT